MFLLRRFQFFPEPPFYEVMDLGTFVSQSQLGKSALYDFSRHSSDSTSEYVYAVYDGSRFVGVVPLVLSESHRVSI